MDMFRVLLKRCSAVFGRRKLDEDLDEELRAHLDLAIHAHVQAGMTREEARTAALRSFGGVTQTREAYRTQRGLPLGETLMRDIRFALRQLRRNPGFTLTVVSTLALAIGANTAIFSIVNALMLKNLPYAQPERMGTIFTRITGKNATDDRHHIDNEQWELLRDDVPALISAVSSMGLSGVNLEASSRVQYVQDARVSAHYFDVLAIQPAMGRNFSEDEDRPHGPPAAILSDRLWHNLFGADRGIVGQAILLKGAPFTVIGVLPQGATTPANADVYTALQPSRNGEGGGTNFEVITRLRDGSNWQEADAEINRAWLARPHRYELEDNPGAQVSYYSVPLQKGQAATLRPQVFALMLAAGFILLIACANLAGLTLVRMVKRTPEVATRLALGASRWQIEKQLWVENLLLALMGGAVGVAVGFITLRGLLLLLPEHFLPVASVSLDGRVLGFALAVSLLTSILFGMLPALTTRKVDLRSSIASRSLAGSGRQRLRQMLIAGEVALTVVLLAAAGLLIRTLAHLETLPPGFNPDGVMTAKASLDDPRYQSRVGFLRLLDASLAAMKQIPGVENAAVGLTLPYEFTLNYGALLHDGPQAQKTVGTDLVYVTPGYFETLQMPLVAGRTFAPSDGPDAPQVAIVNSAFARKFFPGLSPVGRMLDKGTLIVGVVADVQLSSGLNPTAPLMSEETMYVTAAQLDPQLLALVHVFFQPSWIVRTGRPVEGLTAQMQRALSKAAPNLPFSGFYDMRELQAKTLAEQRVEVALLSAMAGLALLMSALGIFALVANMVAQRTREIGIRIALGSSVRQAMIYIGGSGVRAAVVGLVAGLMLCLGTLRAMRSVLYGVGVYDAPTITAVVMTLLVVALLATSIPVLRIARIDPATTLREE
jgi:predicted permease